MAECRPQHHICHLNFDRVCPSCHRTCHRNCDSSLCAFEPCAYCLSVSAAHLVTHENSALCIAAQKDDIGCHACGRRTCWSASPQCYAKCTRDRHVCAKVTQGGCDACGKPCHASNADGRCLFFRRRRGHVTWQAGSQELLDTLHGSRVNVPHITQVAWRFDGETARGARRVLLDGVAYAKGYGFPGRLDDGEQNNCLIDSLRQCLGIACDRRAVRRDLVYEFSGATGRARVTQDSYLDVVEHGRAILRSLFRHNVSDLPTDVDLGLYCVVALAADREDYGVVVGNVRAPHRLVVLNHGDIHFNPCLHLDG